MVVLVVASTPLAFWVEIPGTASSPWDLRRLLVLLWTPLVTLLVTLLVLWILWILWTRTLGETRTLEFLTDFVAHT